MLFIRRIKNLQKCFIKHKIKTFIFDAKIEKKQTNTKALKNNENKHIADFF